ncbi:hypothetical protein FCM35_KLT09849 [Carex littledalei]|uniref:Uncharacterized protein n=1 Tax=Carex littledalei TaxID=544730 RepID=A0A833R9E3_9POAL|nr:hypothetical protein FCM35_KLT09849 [Carex littledalei]
MESNRVMLAASEQPLWEIKLSEEETKTCENYSVLSATLECLALKEEVNMSVKCFDQMISLIKTMLPGNDRLPENFYQAKKLVQEERPGCPYVISAGQDLDIPTVLVQEGVLDVGQNSREQPHEELTQNLMMTASMRAKTNTNLKMKKVLIPTW